MQDGDTGHRDSGGWGQLCSVLAFFLYVDSGGRTWVARLVPVLGVLFIRSLESILLFHSGLFSNVTSSEKASLKISSKTAHSLDFCSLLCKDNSLCLTLQGPTHQNVSCLEEISPEQSQQTRAWVQTCCLQIQEALDFHTSSWVKGKWVLIKTLLVEGRKEVGKPAPSVFGSLLLKEREKKAWCGLEEEGNGGPDPPSLPQLTSNLFILFPF